MQGSSSVAIVSAKRTAIGKFNGSLAKIPASTLGAAVIKDLLASTGVKPEQINEVIMGQVLTAGCGQNPARQASIEGGLPYTTSAYTINKVCGAGLKAVILGAQAILTGDANIVIAGGQESMSMSPHVLANARDGLRMGHAQLLDTMIHDGLWDIYNNYHMGVTAENVAKKHSITREQQDEFALNSQIKAEQAQKSGKFDAEITAIHIPQRKGDAIVFRHDEYIRYGATIEQMQALKPAFDKSGSVTAANASGINDGAAAVMLMSVDMAQKMKLPILGIVKSFASTGLDPAIMGLGPVEACKKCLKRANWNVQDLDVLEINEAFAAQAIAVNQAMQWDTNKVNINGGAIALGHPIGASGCRILVSLLHAMQANNIHKGLASLCIGGGMGIALAVER